MPKNRMVPKPKNLEENLEKKLEKTGNLETWEILKSRQARFFQNPSSQIHITDTIQPRLHTQPFNYRHSLNTIRPMPSPRILAAGTLKPGVLPAGASVSRSK